MTTLRQKLVRKKNRKLRRLRELYPDLRVKLFYARDFRALMLKYGKLALVDELSGTSGQVVPSRSRPAVDDRERRPADPVATPDDRLAVTRPIDLAADVGEVLLTEEAIQAKVAELGARISADYAGRRLTLVSVLKGSLPFMADLMRAITIPVRIDLMEVSSYGGTSTESSGLVRILKDLSASIEGEDVLIVEDIIDTGLTLNYLLRYLRGKNPRVAADLHAARQAGPPPGRDPGRLPRLHDPRPVRRRLRPRLRRALPQPPVRGRPAPRGLSGGA